MESAAGSKIDPKKILAAASKLVEVLSDLSPEERQRVISAAQVSLGQPELAQSATAAASQGASTGSLPKKAAQWLAQNAISREQIDGVFSIEADSVELIARRLPGKSKRQQTVETYLLCGLRSLLQSGESRFADEEARQLCRSVGCYDGANHNNYTKAFDNLVHGTKDSGWTLTVPGLNRAAEIVKAIGSL